MSSKLRVWLHTTAIQLAVWITVYGASVSFGRRLLLLDDSVARGSAPAAWWLLVCACALAPVINAIAIQSVHSVFDQASSAQQIVHLTRLQRLPFRLALAHVLVAWFLALVTLLPPLRPITNDLFSQALQVLLAWTAAAAGELLGYIALRNVAAGISENVAAAVVAEASQKRMEREARGSVVRNRLVLAMVVAVGFVAISASLLVVSYVREEEARGRRIAAHDIALLSAGDEAARQRARSLGFVVTTTEAGADGVAQTRNGGSELRLGTTLVQFDTTLPNGSYGAYVGLIALALITALLAGAWIGGFYGRDLALATHEINAMTYDPDLQRRKRNPRFFVVKELLFAIDGLEQIFERFTRVQERAIHATEAAERMRALFLASMSHDLKAPLNAILGFTEVAKREPLSAAQRESVDIIQQRGRELLELIRTVLDAARMEAGELTLSPRSCRVDELVMEAREARHRAHSNPWGVTLEVQVQQGLESIFVDPTRIQQAIGRHRPVRGALHP